VTPTEAVERLVKTSVHLTDADLDKKYVWEEYDDDGLRFALLTRTISCVRPPRPSPRIGSAPASRSPRPSGSSRRSMRPTAT
jgi:hypothetical protein